MVKVIKVRIEDAGEGSIKAGESYLCSGHVEVLEHHLGKLPSRPYMVEYEIEKDGEWWVDEGHVPKFLAREKGEYDFPCCILNGLGWEGLRVSRKIVEENQP